MQQIPTKLFRSLDEQLRSDAGTISLILDIIAGFACCSSARAGGARVGENSHQGLKENPVSTIDIY